VMKNTTDSNGEVVKAFAVAGHDIDSIGDAVETVDTVVDGIQADLDNGTDGLGAIKTAVDATAPAGEYDTEMAHLNADVDSRAPANEYDTQLDQNLSTTESNIRGADSDTLKTLSDQIDAVSAPAMVG